ncbi:aminotransferase class I/II-fold pyridoxal phosphate-dependent enzyme [Plantibacter sp. ME-Dv--P-122b]|uniref:O-acetylhomoserine aminocarboxypropyltransferase/cysteine synthase family protein n=1 Tax=Plantibacter sp. ME-Dv--P-122b TaxID=3040300 RepID=UPI00254E42CE|nr:aminotransferase class I/II-fold pyridoxal phosphate-dependent enzyme [Plantibacter sp. ME-Dv--P-122b]
MHERDRGGFSTRQLHAGGAPDAPLQPRTMPIYASAGFVFTDFDEAERRFGPDPGGYSYSRVGNPTIDAVERRLAALEGGVDALLLGSGQAAVGVALLSLLEAGDHLLTAPSLYEGSRSLFTENFGRLGITTSEVADPLDTDAWARAIRPETRAIFVESIPNPRNDLTDLRLVADVAHAHGVPLVVDNTFATPYLLRPIEHGADIVVHSASKFLAGHGTVLGGVVIDGGRFDWSARADRYRHLTSPVAALGGLSHVEADGRAALAAYARASVALRLGPTPSPFNAFLIAQGIETLSLRVQRQSENALAIARWLAGRTEVASVDYSGLSDSPHRRLADRYLPDGQGSVFSFTLHGGRDAARTVIDHVGLFTRMTNLGDVRSLILHPASTTHAQRSAEQLAASGIGQGLVRMSVGIEDVADLIADLTSAFDALSVQEPSTSAGASVTADEAVAA